MPDRSSSWFSRNRLNLCLALASVLVALVALEIAYRVYLRRLTEATRNEKLDFSVQDKSYCAYDERLGFRYKPGLSVDWCSIEDGLPELTGTLFLNGRGNSGPEVDDAGAAVRIAVAGDSFTVFQDEGITWPHLLQGMLRERTGRKVAVHNYARDGYGVLQMLDLAAGLVEERPDLILISFATFDLTRDRFWRMEHATPGGVDLFTSSTPTLRFDRPETYVRTALVEPLATRAWAERTRASRDRSDAVLRSLCDTFVREKRNYAITRFDPWSLRSLYLWERVSHPRIRAAGAVNAEVAFNDFSADARFVEDVAKLRSSGIPVYLVLLPWLPDLAFGEYVLVGRAPALLESLKRATGFPLMELLPEKPFGLEAQRMTISRRNAHPSREGLDYYARTTFQALLRDPAVARILLAPGAGGRR